MDELLREESEAGDSTVEQNSGEHVRCGNCRHFSQFPNLKGHNTPQSLGKCLADSWDGNKGQWPMLRHPCKAFGQKWDL